MDPGLYAAASAGNIDEIMKFKDKILDQVTEGTHQTVLHLAALSDNSKCVDAILDKFPSLLDKVDSRNETALHLAAGKGYSYVVKVLLNKAKAINGLDSDEISRPLFDFIRKGNVELDTALHLAVRNNHFKVVEPILRADPDDEHTQNLKSETPLYLAAIGDTHYIILGAIIRNCRNSRVDGPEGRTALHALVISGQYSLIANILLQRPDILERGDNKGWTAFHYAASYNSQFSLDMLIVWGNRDTAVAAMGKTSHDSKQTAHHIAAYEGRIYILKKLLEYCPQACLEVDVDGKNILHIAAEKGHKEIIQFILKDLQTVLDKLWKDNKEILKYLQNVVPKLLNRKDNKRHTPLHLLVIADCFVPEASEVVDEDGRNILHIAAEKGHKELIQSILQDFPYVVHKLVNMKDNNGNTPLHLLVNAGCYVPELIRNKYVDRDIRNYDSLTPHELLYRDENIVADQLMIKNALEDTQVSYLHKVVMKLGWLKKLNLWLTKIKSKNRRRRQPEESSVQEIKRRRKEAKFKIANTSIMKEKVKFYRGRTNTQIIVTALIATVTFTVGFTVPGGNHGDGDVNEGLAILSKKTAFNVCMLADAVGLLFSTSSLFLYFISSLYQDPREVSKFIAMSTGFNIVSVVAMMLTFITGTYVVLFHSLALAIAVSVISCMFFLFVFILLIKLKFDPSEKFDVSV